jgi:hypothetical protein
VSDIHPITIAHGGEPRPVWAIAGLPEGAANVRRIDLRPDDRGFGGDEMLFNGKVIGKSEQPIYAAARWLLANNAAAGCGTRSQPIAAGRYRCTGLLAIWRNGRSLRPRTASLAYRFDATCRFPAIR